MAHQILVENTYSGPLDLLLFLVKRDEIDIHDIPIAHVTREYLREIERMPEVDVDMASEFMAMASILVEIKSRMLLPPTESIDGEEDEDTLDPRAGLVQALLEYKRFKQVASELGQLAEDHARRFARFAPRVELDGEEPETIDELGVMDLFAAFNKMVRTMTRSRPKEIINDEVPTKVRIEQIEMAIAGRDRATFTSLLSDAPTKAEMVGFFIALLELIRLRKVRAQQSDDFSEIYLLPATGEMPSLIPVWQPRRRKPIKVRSLPDPTCSMVFRLAAKVQPGVRLDLFPAFAHLAEATRASTPVQAFPPAPVRSIRQSVRRQSKPQVIAKQAPTASPIQITAPEQASVVLPTAQDIQQDAAPLHMNRSQRLKDAMRGCVPLLPLPYSQSNANVVARVSGALFPVPSRIRIDSVRSVLQLQAFPPAPVSRTARRKQATPIIETDSQPQITLAEKPIPSPSIVNPVENIEANRQPVRNARIGVSSAQQALLPVPMSGKLAHPAKRFAAALLPVAARTPKASVAKGAVPRSPIAAVPRSV